MAKGIMAAEVRAMMKRPGQARMYDNLWLTVLSPERRVWSYRYTLAGKRARWAGQRG